MRAIRHVTLTTGHVRDSLPDEVGPEARRAVGALLSSALAAADRTVPLPVPPGYSISAASGGRCLTVIVWADGPPSVPVCTIGVAGHSRCGAALWREVHRWGVLPVVTDPARPPAEPWVAAALDEGIADHPDAAGWLGDLERCIGWAWLAMLEARR